MNFKEEYFNKWICMDDLLDEPQPVNTQENYSLRGYVCVSVDKPNKDIMGFYIDGTFTYNKVGNQKLWIKILKGILE